jgi:hypothetical protein
MDESYTYIMIPTRQKPLDDDGKPNKQERNILGFPIKVYAISQVDEGIGYPPYFEAYLGEDGMNLRLLEEGTHAYNKVLKLVGKIPKNTEGNGERIPRTAQRRLFNNDCIACLVSEAEAENRLLDDGLYAAIHDLGPAEFKELLDKYLPAAKRSVTKGSTLAATLNS